MEKNSVVIGGVERRREGGEERRKEGRRRVGRKSSIRDRTKERIFIRI